MHFARVLPANRRREARTIAACGIAGLVLTTDMWRVTCERCLRLVNPERERQAREDAATELADGCVPGSDDARGDHERARERDE